MASITRFMASALYVIMPRKGSVEGTGLCFGTFRAIVVEPSDLVPLWAPAAPSQAGAAGLGGLRCKAPGFSRQTPLWSWQPAIGDGLARGLGFEPVAHVLDSDNFRVGMAPQLGEIGGGHVILGAVGDVVGAVDEGVRVAKVEQDRG